MLPQIISEIKDICIFEFKYLNILYLKIYLKRFLLFLCQFNIIFSLLQLIKWIMLLGPFNDSKIIFYQNSVPHHRIIT